MNRNMPFVRAFLLIMLTAWLILATALFVQDTFLDAPPLRMWYTIPGRDDHQTPCGQRPLGEVSNARYSATLSHDGNAMQP
jgi:hypothetical protein